MFLAVQIENCVGLNPLFLNESLKVVYKIHQLAICYNMAFRSFKFVKIYKKDQRFKKIKLP